MKKSSWFIFFLILAVSCLDDPDCFRLNNNVVGFAFRVIGTNRADTVRLTMVEITGTSSIVPDTVTSQVYVPVNFTTTQSTITFSYDDGRTNYVNLEYLLKTQFISPDCGSRYELSDLRAADSDIDSVRVISGSPNKAAGAINVELLRCPNPRYVGVAFFNMSPPTSATADPTSKAGSLAVDSITTDYSSDVFYRRSSRAIYYLPVNPGATQTTFHFHTRGGTAPLNLQLTYTTRSRNPFPALCGDILAVENMAITVDPALAATDSLGVDEDNEFLDYLTDPPSSNVRLFRCPQTNMARLVFRRYTSAQTTTQTQDDTIAVKRITSDYAEGAVYAANQDLRVVTLPVNPASNETTFYIEYTDTNIPTDTVRVRYTATSRASDIPVCGDLTTYTELTEVGDDGNTNNIIVAPGGTINTSTLHNPPTTYTNIQVIHAADQ